MTEAIKAIFFDAGNTLVFPRIEELAQELTAQGSPATVEDFRAADRQGRAKPRPQPVRDVIALRLRHVDLLHQRAQVFVPVDVIDRPR